jgi:hypothetical protein
MPLATKNNAIIVKDGKLAESCGCCGGWYCYAAGCDDICTTCGPQSANYIARPRNVSIRVVMTVNGYSGSADIAMKANTQADNEFVAPDGICAGYASSPTALGITLRGGGPGQIDASIQGGFLLNIFPRINSVLSNRDNARFQWVGSGGVNTLRPSGGAANLTSDGRTTVSFDSGIQWKTGAASTSAPLCYADLVMPTMPVVIASYSGLQPAMATVSVIGVS